MYPTNQEIQVENLTRPYEIHTINSNVKFCVVASDFDEYNHCIQTLGYPVVFTDGSGAGAEIIPAETPFERSVARMPL